MNLSFTLFDRAFIFSATVGRKRSEPVVGYSNRTKDGMCIVTIDYDNLILDWIRPELERLQKEFCLSTFYLFSSGNGYHAVCFDKLTLKEYMQVLWSSSVDPDYFRVPLLWHKRCWVLRVTPKSTGAVKLVDTVPAASLRTQSHAHARLLRNIGLIPDTGTPTIADTDGEGELILTRYMT